MRASPWLVAGLCGGLMSCNTAAFKHTYMAMDQRGDRQRTVFYTDSDKIFCIGEMAIGRKGVTVTAELRQTAVTVPPTGQSAPIDGVLATKDVSPTETGSDIMVTFELKKSNAGGPWAAGQFICELTLDGVLEASVPFQIAYPGCPAQPPLAGDTCRGFFLPESQCQGANQSQDCVCAASGVWECR